ncbi:PadR family transcriptional regulator [Intrasporangium calvum]|uniref:Transcriptional regulator, PadR family n=1 Tax=Intrasporangium calvum (strain ATCC 23552 / DSM 43043 / JCM 3097 / NBRC 12989 / NCIMB 10167 / NRRL B-3866 / 7 KIP) TaxID=710696 RepID=E6S6D2_INTC7|nr:PadR family transcriptional regulator [Intrasporangium calvum]ADU48921.1 transcriptional regulator, PadR family [Intrasporangium calvum DSM 43043]AXG13897.1 PadR family transcriptional regulator [Intrasporangium calvum]
MSVRQGLMALLAQEPMYGARLRAEFEARTGGTWPLNVGQVYTTLARLERDGLVVASGGDDEGRIEYALTDAGRAETSQWWLTPVTREASPRDELVIKLALAVTLPGVDVAGVVQAQRTATLKHLRDLTRLKARAEEPADGRDLAWSLVLENHLFSAEAEARWLDHIETALSRHGGRMPLGSPPSPPDDDEAAESKTVRAGNSEGTR